MFACFKLGGFFHRFTNDEDHRHDHAANQKRNSPAPIAHVLRAEPMVKAHTQQPGKYHRCLLARRLPTDEKALAAGCGNFCQIHRYAAQLHTRGKTLQQAAQQNQQRRRYAQGGVAGYAGDQHSAHRHQGQGDDQPFAAAVTVNISAEKDRTQWAH